MTTPSRPYPTTLLAAGSNARGQLGTGSTDDAHSFTPCVFEDHGLQLPTNTARILGLASGSSHTVILLQSKDGDVQLWGAGDGSKGQLGPDRNAPMEASKDEPFVFRPLSMPFGELFQQRRLPYTCRLVAAAWETTYLVLSCPGRPDVLISMGSHDFGALGGGENLNAANKARIVNLASALDEKAGAKPPNSILTIESLQAGPRHVVVELQTRTVDGATLSSVLVGWGSSRQGQLGQKTKAAVISRPALIPIDVASDPMRCCALGNEHTVVLHESNRISVLGSNRKDQLDGLSLLQMPIERIGCTWNGTYVHTRERMQDLLLATGSNAKGQLGRTNSAVSNSNTIGIVKLPIEPTTHIIKLACGSEHVLVLTSPSRDMGKGISNSVWGWGWNEHGNLGLGMLEDVTLPAQIWPRDGASPIGNVVDVWAACGTSWLALPSQ